MLKHSFFVLFFFYASTLFAASEIKKYNFQSKKGFEENLGQIKYLDNKPAPEVKYVFKQGNLKIFLLKTGLAYQL